MDKIIRISAVVLASGMSKRMGEVKQLLPLDGTPLLEYVLRKLLPLPFQSIHAIIGNQHQSIREQIQVKDPRFNWVINEKFSAGQSSALKKGVEVQSDADGILVFLADQPLILEETVRTILDEANRLLLHSEKRIVVQPSYLGQKGHPVFFSKSLFPLFSILEGDEGGKKIIQKASEHKVIAVDDPGILFDIDTKEDYSKVLETIIQCNK